MKTYTLEELTDKHIGKKGTPKRDKFDKQLELDVLAYTIKEIRKAKHLTQGELGELVGVKKAQISKIENNLTDARFETILRIFRALNAKLSFRVEVDDKAFIIG